MAARRWQLYDPAIFETWEMPINPDSMSPVPLVTRQMRHSPAGRDSRVQTFVGAPDAMHLEWAGVIRTKDHYDKLDEWSRKPEFWVYDHLDRVWKVVPIAFAPQERRPTIRTPWRLRYTMRTVILEKIGLDPVESTVSPTV